MVAEVFTEAVADFMVAEVFTAGEDSPAADALVLVEAARLVAGIAAATAADFMEVAAVMDGAAEVGEEAMGTAGAAAGAGDLALAGLIGTMVGAIRMATTATIRGIMRHIPILIRILPTVIRKTT